MIAAGNPAMNKTIVILGPTSSGKSALGIRLARKFNGEIISADSRQVYKGMDVGTGKVTGAEQRLVPHHLLDVASPKKQFSVAEYKKLAQRAMQDIQRGGKVPFIVGGTAFYVYALIDDLGLPTAKPNAKLRRELAKKTPAQLFAMLKKIDPKRAQSIDQKNPTRLIRAIEIVKATGKPVPELAQAKASKDVLILGISKPQKELYKLIDKRLEERLEGGMVTEAKQLLKQGVTHKKLEAFGLEYRFLSRCLRGQLSRDKMLAQLKIAHHQYAKRQMTWFKRDKRIRWISKATEAERLVKKFLK
jgi:tRNA dimethylallyltransferase